MKNMLENLKNFHKDEQGDIVQAGIIIGILATLAIGAFAFLTPKLKLMFKKTGDQLDAGNAVDGTIE